jgi:D-lactate dehydrogenase
MKKIVFFEFTELENQILKENIQITEGLDITFLTEKFHISLVPDNTQAISIFVDSHIYHTDLIQLKKKGVKHIALRCSGFDMLDTSYASKLNIDVTRVPSYSPQSIAEYVFAVLLNLVRKLNYQRKLHESNISIRDEYSLGFTLKDKVLGLHGCGEIGKYVGRIAKLGFGMKVRYFDPFVENNEFEKVTDLKTLYSTCDFVSIHTALNDSTRNCVNMSLLSLTQKRFILINSARGNIVNSNDIIEMLSDESREFYFGCDVWGDNDLFDERLLRDDSIQTFHTGYLTQEALKEILLVTFNSLKK